MSVDVFLSVGKTLTDDQKNFVDAVEAQLRSQSLSPRGLGRTDWTAGQPLKAIDEIMSQCCGTVVIAFERLFVEKGSERRHGSPLDRQDLSGVQITTVWNQIEAALAHARQQPLLVLVDEGVRLDGLLERSFDWFVYVRRADTPHLNTPEFSGIVADWKRRVLDCQAAKAKKAPTTGTISTDLNDLSLGQLVRGLKVTQAWALFLLLGGAFGSTFTAGHQFGPRLFGTTTETQKNAAPDDDSTRTALKDLAAREPPYYGASSWNVRPQMEAFIEDFQISDHPQLLRATLRLRDLIAAKANPDPGQSAQTFQADSEFRASLSTFLSSVNTYSVTGRWTGDV